MILRKEDMNPKSLCLKVGQTFERIVKSDNGHETRKERIEVRKFYRNHVLCRVNGRKNECFTYNELSQMENIREGMKNANRQVI